MVINSGDWVRFDAKGVWQAVRQVPDHYAPRYSSQHAKSIVEGPLWILKRFANDKWKPSFEMTAASAAAVKPLTKADRLKLDRYLQANEPAFREFEAFEQPVHSILNLGFSLPRRGDFSKFKREFEQGLAAPLAAGMTSDAILQRIADSSFAGCLGDVPRAATLQFICENHEVKRRELIYRRLNVHDF